MDAGLPREVDRSDCLRHPAHGAFSDMLRRPNEGDDRAIVIRIERDVEHFDVRRRGDCVRNRLHLARVPPLGKIRHALDHGRWHRILIVL